jgi:F-type H+-transporting ATPase subunit epsilon
MADDEGNPDKVRFELVSPERQLASGEVDMVVCPGAAGDFGVLPQHSLLLSLLRPGVLEIWEGNSVAERIFVGGGFAEVNEKGCIVLAEEAMPVGELDRGQAEQRLQDARDDLSEAKDDLERERYEREIAIAEAQLEAAGAH